MMMLNVCFQCKLFADDNFSTTTSLKMLGIEWDDHDFHA